MKRNSILFLFGVLLFSCGDNNDSSNSLCDDLRASFYDIQAMAVNGLINEETDPSYRYWLTKPIPAGQSVTSNNFILELKSTSNIRYVKNEKNTKFNFSLIRLAQACTPAPPRTNEIISMINITSNTDFDATHPAGSNLNDLFTVKYTNGNGVKADFYLNGVKTYNLNEFILAAPQGMNNIHLKLSQGPLLSKIHNFKIEYAQTDGDYYEMYLDNVTFE